MIIRLAQLEDMPQICGFYTKFYKYTSAQQPYYYKEITESGTYPKSIIEGNEGDVLVAEESGVIIGFLLILETKTLPYPVLAEHRLAKVVDLFVDENCRAKGVGRALMAEAQKWAAARELEYLELNVLANNEGALKFYAKENFEAVHYVMRRKL